MVAVYDGELLGTEWSTAEIQAYHKDTVIGGQAQIEYIIGGIIILMTPAPIIDPFPAWKP